LHHIRVATILSQQVLTPCLELHYGNSKRELV
jgi:hypothetical protein